MWGALAGCLSRNEALWAERSVGSLVMSVDISALMTSDTLVGTGEGRVERAFRSRMVCS